MSENRNLWVVAAVYGGNHWVKDQDSNLICDAVSKDLAAQIVREHELVRKFVETLRMLKDAAGETEIEDAMRAAITALNKTEKP